MKLLTSRQGHTCLGLDQRTTLLQAMRKKHGESERGQGLWVDKQELEDWIKLMEPTGKPLQPTGFAGG